MDICLRESNGLEARGFLLHSVVQGSHQSNEYVVCLRGNRDVALYIWNKTSSTKGVSL
jgi:hypothetical protein